MRPLDSTTHQPVNEAAPDLSRAAFRRWLETHPAHTHLGRTYEGTLIHRFAASQGFSGVAGGFDELNWRTPQGLRYVYTPVYLSIFGNVLAMRFYGHREDSQATAGDALSVLDEIPTTWDHLDNNREAATPARPFYTGAEWERWYDRWLDTFGPLREAACKAGEPYANVAVTVNL